MLLPVSLEAADAELDTLPLGSPMQPIFFTGSLPFMLFTEIVLLATKYENLGATWPQSLEL